MAIIELSSLIDSMHGPVGEAVMYRRYGKIIMRRRVKGKNPNTIAQRTNRRSFADAVKLWQALTLNEKCTFNKRAVKLCMSGYNLFISEHMNTQIYMQKENNPVYGSEMVSSSIIPLRFPSVSPSLPALSCETTTQIPFYYRYG